MLTTLASNTKDSFGHLRPWVEVQMQRPLQSISNYPPEIMKFDWLYVAPEQHSTVLSYPIEKRVPPRLGPPNTQAMMLARVKQRKARRTYNHQIVSLRQAANAQA